MSLHQPREVEDPLRKKLKKVGTHVNELHDSLFLAAILYRTIRSMKFSSVEVDLFCFLLNDIAISADKGNY